MPNLTKYSLDHEVRSSFEMGQLIPFLCQEVVPGDKYRVQSSTLVRLQPMLSPLMHRLDYYQRYYYVPYRLLIPNYEQLLTDPDSGNTVPGMDKYLQYTAHTLRDLFLEKPLLEYFGLASSLDGTHPDNVIKDLNATPLLAYYLIYNHYYMRSDLDSRYVDQLRPENFSSAEIRKYIGNVMYVNEGLDYFTSAHTSTQYGNMVQLDMDGNGTITVPEMRLAERLQSFRERLLRVGGKYVNYIKEFFGVEPLDARVQIPKYLGGDSYVLNVSDVDQTAPSELGSVGESYGKSVSVNRTGQIQYDVYEHGLIIGLHFVRPRPSNIGGCPKLFTRRTYFDFFNPHFSALGYQEIESRELDVARPKDEAFGYVPRYDEYRYGNDIVSGDFKRSLDYWHMSRDISKEKLSVDFVTCHPDNRVFSFQNSRPDLCRIQMIGNIIGVGAVGTSKFLLDGYAWIPKSALQQGSDIMFSISKESIADDPKLLFMGQLSSFQDVDSVSLVPGRVDQNTVFFNTWTRGTDVSDRFDLDRNTIIEIHEDDYSSRASLGSLSYISFGGETYPFLLDVRKTIQLTNAMDPSSLAVFNDGENGFKQLVSLPLGFYTLMPYDTAKPMDNHVLSVTYNNVDVLRPLARYDGNVLR
ncbi:major capsid protein [Microvirus sp.]|nr:major capsid protein [Microvirus sp.]